MEYHFIGIKGSGMSALAQILSDLGNNVQGSDVEDFIFTQLGLTKRNIPILKFNSSNIKLGQIIILGNAFNEEHQEVKKANELGLPIYRYNEYLGGFLTDFYSIAITGTHGKTSTTGLLAHVFNSVMTTNYLIGDGTGKVNDTSKHFIFEACEYKRHFLSYKPSMAIINNIDFDHPDYFSDIKDVEAAFTEFSKGVKERIIANGDDPHLKGKNFTVPTVYFGFDERNNVIAKNIRPTKNGTTFDVYINGHFYYDFFIKQHGKHNILNTLAVITVCYYNEIEISDIQSAFLSYEGVQRRFNEKTYKNQIIIDDYAHHPTEITATIMTAKEKYPNRPIIAVFQPHTYSRTYKFIDDFAQSLSNAHCVYLFEIFGSARENKSNESVLDLSSRVPNSKILEEENINELANHKNGVLLFMGAGDIQKYHSKYLVEQ
ncbi:UDP-N-acetylmuramate--L-alanine ligase [Peribacillus sp. NPDC097675]|uniref:UDP-N-acetylmuramate--L-alanine ligase n=1 Tax=Peribacillus sp. NPDC097675 TaxID=3390618 RepID=UPI003D01FB22